MSRKLLLIFGFFWSAITCTVLGILLYGAINQLRALYFATADGIVDSVKVAEDSSGESTTYGIKIAYRYIVKDHWYRSERLRFVPGASSDSWASEMAGRFPAGRHVAVHYNPANPAEAVLIPGIQGQDLFLALFITPFTMVMLGIWTGIATSFRKENDFVGLRVLKEGSTTRIRPSAWQAVGAGGVCLGLGAFISIFIVAFGFGGFHPSMKVVASAWIVVITLATLAGAATWKGIRSGARDITLDRLSHTLTGPKGVAIAYADINRVNVIKRAGKGDDGGSSANELWLELIGDRRIKLEAWVWNERQARRFAEWIAREAGVGLEDGAADMR